MKKLLIPDWHKAWRYLSVQATALLALLSAVQANLLPSIQPIVPAQYWPYVTAGFGVAIGILRILPQPALDAPDAASPPAAPADGSKP